MELRRPAVHRRRVPVWRRSGDESYLESLISEEEPLSRVTHPSRPPRPQSAIEGGGQLDTWLENLRTMQRDSRTPVHNPSSDQTTSVPFLDKAPAWRQKCYPFFSASSSSCGSSSLCESSRSSQDSLQTGFLAPPRHRGNWEKAHVMQSPGKEQAQLSYLTPVKTDWLPIQRRVMGSACSPNQGLDNSVGQVKLKQPITPTFQMNEETPRVQDAMLGSSHTSSSALGVKTWRTPDQGSPVIKKVPEKLCFPDEGGDRCVGWQALRTSWKVNRVSAFPGGYKLNEFSTKTSEDPDHKSVLMKTPSTESIKHPPLHCTSADPGDHYTLLQGTNTSDTYKSHTPLQRTRSVQPIKATQFYGTSSCSDASYIPSNSVLTALVPPNKAAFSSITISSRKVNRSASLPGSNSSKRSPSPTLDPQPMDPHSRQKRVQKKPTIVKVTEKRVISTSGPSPNRPGTPQASHPLDTVISRRKATIIKVTEHKERYIPTKNPEHRHSYTEGLYKDNSTQSLQNGSANITTPSYHHLNSEPNSSTASNTFTSSLKEHGTLHRSTISFFVSSPPAVSPSSFEVSSKAVGLTSDRLKRPLSCYGNLIGHTEPNTENAAQSDARKWSFRPPQGTHINPVNFNSGFISSGKAEEEAGQPVADTLSPRRDKKKRMSPSVGGMRRASPSLTLIEAPDPHHSEEEVLALNAAAIIANIKLQRQLSKKKTLNGNSEKDSAASPQGNTVTDEKKSTVSNSERSKVQHQKQPHAEYVPLRMDQERSSDTISLQQALKSSRPDFIRRSQSRVRELERQAQERRERSGLGDRQLGVVLQQRKDHSMKPTSVNGNLFRDRETERYF